MKKAYLKYFVGLLLFGSNGVIASYIHLSSYEIVLLRSLLGIALLLGLLSAANKDFLWRLLQPTGFLFYCLVWSIRASAVIAIFPRSAIFLRNP